jgi:nucleotide-binding universal stress UspA family protein
MDSTPAGPIVVGIDGSSASVAALRWAANMAAAQRRELVAVAVWEPHPIAPYAPPEGLHPEERERPEHVLTAAVCEAVAAVPGVKVRQVPAAGLPARVLLRQAEGAELLVLGSHRHATAYSPAPGPVVLACLRGAPCPVVVVRERDEPVPSPRQPEEVRAHERRDRRPSQPGVPPPGNTVAPRASTERMADQ